MNEWRGALSRIGNVGGYAKFYPDGSLEFFDAATVWVDVNFPAATLGIGVSAPDMIQINGGTIYRRAFDGVNTTEQLFEDVEVPHGWRPGLVKAHLHTQVTTADAGDYKFSLTWTATDEDNPDEPAEQTVSIVTAAPEVAWRSQFAAFPDIDLSSFGIGTQFGFRLWRDPDDAADTYEHDVALKTVGLHVELKALGSRTISGVW